MKKLISLGLSAVLSFSMMSSSFAEVIPGTTIPNIYVNDREIAFEDQTPVIDISVNRTLIPLRGVFEAMGAAVYWKAEERQVIVDSEDNLKRVVLNIDNPTMKVMTAVSLVKYETEEVTLETAPIIMNNRTMIPLRAVIEAMDGKVDWNNDTHTATIHSKGYGKYMAEMTEENKGDNEDYVYDIKEDTINLSIEADKEEVEAGDTVTITVNLSNTDILEDGWTFQSITNTLFYDLDNFALSSVDLIVNGEVTKVQIGGNNPEFMGDSLKSVFFIMPDSVPEDISDGAIIKATFESLNGEAGEFRLSNRKTSFGYDNGVLFTNGTDSKNLETFEYLHIDTTPILVK